MAQSFPRMEFPDIEQSIRHVQYYVYLFKKLFKIYFLLNNFGEEYFVLSVNICLQPTELP